MCCTFPWSEFLQVHLHGVEPQCGGAPIGLCAVLGLLLMVSTMDLDAFFLGTFRRL